MAEIKINLGAIIDQSGYNRIDMPEKLGVAYNTIKGYANNSVQRPDLDLLAKVCIKLGVTVEELFSLELTPEELQEWQRNRRRRMKDQKSQEVDPDPQAPGVRTLAQAPTW